MRIPSPTTLTFLLLLTLIAAFFLLLTLFVRDHPLNSLDLLVTRIIQHRPYFFFDQVMSCISFNGHTMPLILLITLTALAYYWHSYRLEAVMIFFTLAGGLAASVIKVWIDRPRPNAAYLRVLIDDSSASYPSTTVVMVVLFFGFNIFLTGYLRRASISIKRIIWLSGCFMIIAVPVARIYVGAHWFTDVVGGALLGLLFFVPLCFFYHKRRSHQAKITSGAFVNPGELAGSHARIMPESIRQSELQ